MYSIVGDAYPSKNMLSARESSISLLIATRLTTAHAISLLVCILTPLDTPTTLQTILFNSNPRVHSTGEKFVDAVLAQNC